MTLVMLKMNIFFGLLLNLASRHISGSVSDSDCLALIIGH